MTDEIRGRTNLDAYLHRCQLGLVEIIRFLGGVAEGTESLSELRARLEKRRSDLKGGTQIAVLLHINVQQVGDLFLAVRRTANAFERPHDSAIVQSNAQIAALRLLDLFDSIKENNPQLVLDTALPEYGTDPVVAGTQTQQQVRALELIIRSLIGEAYGSEDRLRAHFEALNRVAVAQWLKVGDKGDLLSGSMFGELVSMFVSEPEYKENYEKFFEDTSFLEFLDEKRVTLQTFLEDVRSIRNRVAHHKRVTPVQIALLDHYYREIIEPIQTAFDGGRTRVNPDSYFDATSEQLKQYFDKVESSFAILGDKVDEINVNLTGLGTDVRTIKEGVGEVSKGVGDVSTRVSGIGKKIGMVIVALLIVGGIAAMTLGTSTSTLINTSFLRTGMKDVEGKLSNVKQETSSDPRKELSNQGIAWTESDFRNAIGRGDLPTIKLFLSGGMPWRDFYATPALKNHRTDVVELLLAHTDKLDIHPSDCAIVLGAPIVTFDPLPPGDRRNTNDLHAHQITPIEKRFVKSVCTQPEDIAYIHRAYDTAIRSSIAQKNAYNAALKSIKPVEQCRRELMAGGGGAALGQAMQFHSGHATYDAYDEMMVNLQSLILAQQATLSKIQGLVDKYCTTQASEKPNIYTNDWDVHAWKQVVDIVG